MVLKETSSQILAIEPLTFIGFDHF